MILFYTLTFYCSKYADNGLPWIKPVQNFTIPMLTDLRQRAKWTQTRKEKKEKTLGWVYIDASLLQVLSIHFVLVVRSRDWTKWEIGHFRGTFSSVSSPRGKWTFPCEWFARRLLWGKKQLDNGLLKKDRAKLRAWFTDESTERGLRTVFNRSRLFESSAHQWQSVSARVWSWELALSLQSQ